MKKIINGKKYDTETAKMVCNYYNGLPSTDFRSFSAELYKKRTGEFFLVKSGGPMTECAVSCGNTTSGSTFIEPITEEEAVSFAQGNMNVNDYEKMFGEVPE